MAEKLYKICLHCSDTVVEGCESMTQEQVDIWMSENNETLETPAECGDTVKYIQIPLEN
mgnify:CR=1 FL=1